MKLEGSVVVRSGTSRVTVELESPMPSEKYHVVASIIEPERDKRPENLTMEVLPGKLPTEFILKFNMKLPVKLRVVFIAEHA